MLNTTENRLQCDMSDECKRTVTHIEEKGWIYCKDHGLERRAGGRRCRALRPWEVRLLLSAVPLPSYTPKRKPSVVGGAR